MPIDLTERFVRQYSKLHKAIQKKVDKALILLDTDFRHSGLRSHPVESAPGVFEAYVDRKYRMTFEHRADIFVMRNVDNHDECLRSP
jgi:5S rRNA maturation endonuclease (ribonuclease M5)